MQLFSADAKIFLKKILPPKTLKKKIPSKVAHNRTKNFPISVMNGVGKTFYGIPSLQTYRLRQEGK